MSQPDNSKQIQIRTNAGLQEKLREALAQKFQSAHVQSSGPVGEVPDTTALLLDRSGSMISGIGDARGTKRIEALRKLMLEFPQVRKFTFDDDCEEIPRDAQVGDPRGWTALDIAFLTVKDKGVKHVILITDGRPDDADAALWAAGGLKIDCFYVGPDPAPPFLADLCRRTGGRYGRASFTSPKELAGGIRGLLPAPSGPIQL